MSEPKSFSRDFRKRFSDFFWWTPPISFIADAIAIFSALTVKKQNVIQPLNSYPYPEPLVWGIITLSDMVIISGFLTAFAVVAITYTGIIKRKEKANSWPIIFAIFASLFLLYIYFRLWLGEFWWIFICIVPIFLVITLIISSIGAGATNSIIGESHSGITQSANKPSRNNESGIPYRREHYSEVNISKSPDKKPTMGEQLWEEIATPVETPTKKAPSERRGIFEQIWEDINSPPKNVKTPFRNVKTPLEDIRSPIENVKPPFEPRKPQQQKTTNQQKPSIWSQIWKEMNKPVDSNDEEDERD